MLRDVGLRNSSDRFLCLLFLELLLSLPLGFLLLADFTYPQRSPPVDAGSVQPELLVLHGQTVALSQPCSPEFQREV